MDRLKELEYQLRRVQGHLMRWPRAIRLQLQAQDLIRQIHHERNQRRRALRGVIRRSLMDLDLEVLERLVREARPCGG